MCFHGNQYPWAIKHSFISLYSKYQSLNFICLPEVNSLVFPSLDDIFCMKVGQHYYSTTSKIRTRAFGALTGV